MEKSNSKMKFLWRISASHVVAYFIAGLFAVTFLNYREHFVSQTLSLLMRPVDDALVALGPGLQILRGLIIGVCLLPLRKVFVVEKKGFLKLALLVLGLSALSTIGPTPGSFEGVIYTIIPLQYHLLGLPETLLYVSLFTFLLWLFYRVDKKWLTVLSAIFIAVICLFSILGYLAAVGMLPV